MSQVFLPFSSPLITGVPDYLLANRLAQQPQRTCTTTILLSPVQSSKTAPLSRNRASSERFRPRSHPRDFHSPHPTPPYPTAHTPYTNKKAGSFMSLTLGNSHDLVIRPCHDNDQFTEGEAFHNPLCHASTPRLQYNIEACLHSSHFPPNHHLDSTFVQLYQLEDELGSGGYGFVMTAYHRTEGCEVAVKFIIKDKVPEHAWMDDPVTGRLPTEVVLLSGIRHPNIVRCLDLFEDALYFYLVQELHGSPWVKHHNFDIQSPCFSRSASSLSTPVLSPSSSEKSLPCSTPNTPPHQYASLHPHLSIYEGGSSLLMHDEQSVPSPSRLLVGRPEISRRPSHDLFECIEQSENKKLTEDQARYVFNQVVDAVDYLHKRGIVHRDIKDENLVIDRNLRVKLIDFGSAIAVKANEPLPYYNMFCGTAAYASSEILLKKTYQAIPAEIWTLGILLSYLLAGISPFPTARDAVEGRIFLSEKIVGKISDEPMDLMRRCLDPNPETRITISQMKSHPWLCTHSLL